MTTDTTPTTPAPLVAGDIIGAFNGPCNRSDCHTKPATFYYWSTRKFYCASCATMLNKANAGDSWVKSLGHQLCTEGEPS
jgi:hypothetical protein